MDRLAEKHGGGAPWPSFPESASPTWPDHSAAPRADHDTGGCCALDDVMPRLGWSEEPLLIEIEVTPYKTFEP